MSAFDRSTMSDIASSHVAGSRRPRRRMSGVVSRSGLAFASQPCMPFGPRRPWLTRSAARPRTPTIWLPATATSMPQPYEHSTQTDWTHRSGVAVVRSSTRAGHAPACGVRGPPMSAMASRVWDAVTLLALLRQLVEALLDALERASSLVPSKWWSDRHAHSSWWGERPQHPAARLGGAVLFSALPSQVCHTTGARRASGDLGGASARDGQRQVVREHSIAGAHGPVTLHVELVALHALVDDERQRDVEPAVRRFRDGGLDASRRLEPPAVGLLRLGARPPPKVRRGLDLAHDHHRRARELEERADVLEGGRGVGDVGAVRRDEVEERGLVVAQHTDGAIGPHAHVRLHRMVGTVVTHEP